MYTWLYTNTGHIWSRGPQRPRWGGGCAFHTSERTGHQCGGQVQHYLWWVSVQFLWSVLTSLSCETAVCAQWALAGPECDGDGAGGNWCQLLGPLWKQEAAHRCAWGAVGAGLHPGSACPSEKPIYCFSRESQPRGRHLSAVQGPTALVSS